MGIEIKYCIKALKAKRWFADYYKNNKYNRVSHMYMAIQKLGSLRRYELSMIN